MTTIMPSDPQQERESSRERFLTDQAETDAAKEPSSECETIRRRFVLIKGDKLLGAFDTEDVCRGEHAPARPRQRPQFIPRTTQVLESTNRCTVSTLELGRGARSSEYQRQLRAPRRRPSRRTLPRLMHPSRLVAGARTSHFGSGSLESTAAELADSFQPVSRSKPCSTPARRSAADRRGYPRSA